MVRRLAVRKILRARRAIRGVLVVATISLILSLLGLVMYVFYVPSEVILMEAFVWLIEALSFGSLALAFKIAASKTVTYRARYELLRLEALAALITSVVAMFVTSTIMYKAVTAEHREPSPIIVSVYPLGSGIMSFILEHRLSRILRGMRIKLVSVRMIAEKLKLDVVFELGGGVAIIAANLLNSALYETVAALVMSVYVLMGLYGIAREAAMHLLGLVPKSVHRDMEAKVRALLHKVTRYRRIRRLKLESYGTFSEVELWLEAPSSISLGEAYYESIRIARELIHNIPELLRALVVLVPEKEATSQLAMRLSEEVPRTRLGRRRRQVRLSSSRSVSRSLRGSVQSLQPRQVPRRVQSQQQRSGDGESQASSP
ncbi:putative Co/Zn/Cd cation transporter [Hyperthermus butylicus DSM 5456]|uniref:Co/Zn/Cd cation transporter n=1 Tax=Hyperthermus butylicus (strain DSM 5456 / JCM 9403 / PLM1-5) TaxID=415426 RepID=A2BKD7_HYPBU|nr:putative Co/Zn/Cd cation transporter [Hyperthermus butylicus DSM 5456]